MQVVVVAQASSKVSNGVTCLCMVRNMQAKNQTLIIYTIVSLLAGLHFRESRDCVLNSLDVTPCSLIPRKHLLLSAKCTHFALAIG